MITLGSSLERIDQDRDVAAVVVGMDRSSYQLLQDTVCSAMHPSEQQGLSVHRYESRYGLPH